MICDDVIFVVDHALKLTCAHVEHQADAGRHALIEPDVGNRNSKFDVAHALATDAAEGNFDTAAVANHAFVFDALVFTASTFPVTGWSENALTEETAFFWLEGPVVNGFRIFHFTFRPTPDDFRGCYGDGNLIEGFWTFVHAKDFAKVIVDTHIR